MVPRTIFKRCCHLCELLLWVGESSGLCLGSRVLIPARIVCVLMKRMGGTCSDGRLCPDASGRGRDYPILR